MSEAASCAAAVADQAAVLGAETGRRVLGSYDAGSTPASSRAVCEGGDPGHQQLPVVGDVVRGPCPQVLEDRERLDQGRAVAALDDRAQLGLVVLDRVAVALAAAAPGQQRQATTSAATPSAGSGHPSSSRSWSFSRSAASASPSGPAPRSSRDVLGRTWRAAAPEDPVQVGDGAALGAVPRGEDRAVDVEPVVAAVDGGADHGAEVAERVGVGVELAQVVEHDVGDGAVAGAGLLHLRALLVGGERQHEDPAPVPPRGVDHRGQRAEAEVGAGRDGVDGQRRGGVEVGVGVGLAGGADVAALDVEQHQRAASRQAATSRSSTAMPRLPKRS